VKTFNVTASNYKFSTSAMSVNKGDTVRITLKNTDGTHDLKVDGYDVKTKLLSSGQEDTIEFTADKIGTFDFYCTYGNHRQMGMKGTLTVK
jgi:cytochrome c oxidase subunit 2